jgi:hypothetical protein
LLHKSSILSPELVSVHDAPSSVTNRTEETGGGEYEKVRWAKEEESHISYESLPVTLLFHLVKIKYEDRKK